MRSGLCETLCEKRKWKRRKEGGISVMSPDEVFSEFIFFGIVELFELVAKCPLQV